MLITVFSHNKSCVSPLHTYACDDSLHPTYFYNTIFIRRTASVSSLLAQFPKSLSCHLSSPQRDLQEPFTHKHTHTHTHTRTHTHKHWSYDTLVSLYPHSCSSSLCKPCIPKVTRLQECPKRCKSANGRNFLCTCVCTCVCVFVYCSSCQRRASLGGKWHSHTTDKQFTNDLVYWHPCVAVNWISFVMTRLIFDSFFLF